MSTVKIAHPDLPGQEIEVPEVSLPHHLRAGWAPVEPEPEPPATEKRKPKHGDEKPAASERAEQSSSTRTRER